MTDKRLLGAFGEQRAALFLRENGYRILSANFRCECGEIDVIAEKDGIIFGRIEVYPLRVRRVDFCGYAVGMLNGTLSTRMRPKTVRRYRRRLHIAANHLAAMCATTSQRATVLGGFAAESLRQTIASYEGIALHADTHNLLINLKRNYHEIYRTSDREPDCSRHERERVATA